jgi:hypothetical protein
MHHEHSTRLRSMSSLAVAVLAGGALCAADAPRMATGRSHAPVMVHRNEDGTLTHTVAGNKNRPAMETSNWSGYAVAKYQTKQTYTSASATWTVPSVTFGPTKSKRTTVEYSSSWVGIGGFCETAVCSTVDNSLIQLGTEQDAESGGVTQYYAWYEMLPADSIIIADFPVKPGDTITASLECVANCTEKKQSWKLSMVNGSQSWSETFEYKSRLLSAVFIEEAPTGRAGVLPLSEPTSPVAFAQTVANGVATDGLPIGKNGIAMVNPAGQTSVPSPTDGDAFDACWGYHDAKSLPACEAPVAPIN